MKKLSLKQKKFIAEYIKNNGNQTQAALKSYGTDQKPVTYQTARQIGVENLQKPSIRAELDKALVKYEINLDTAVKPIADALEATKTYGSKDGIEVTDVPQHSTRLKASDMALTLLGVKQAPPVSLHLHKHLLEKSKKYSI